MASTVDIDALLADALRKLLAIATQDEPEWLTDEGTIERRKAYLAAQYALLVYDEVEPASVMSLPSVAQPRPGGSLAIAS